MVGGWERVGTCDSVECLVACGGLRFGVVERVMIEFDDFVLGVSVSIKM